jgi:guanylate cyclase
VGLLRRLVSVGVRADDSPDERLQKRLQTAMALASVVIIAGHSGLMVHAGLRGAPWFDAGYCVATLALVLLTALSGRHGLIKYGHLAVVGLGPFLLHWYLGGFASSGGIYMWSFMAAFAALMFLPGTRVGVTLAALTTLLLFASLWAEAWPWPGGGEQLPAAVHRQQLMFNSVGMLLFAWFSLRYYSRRIDAERARSEALLLNVLPRSIAERLKRGESPIADRVESATILFADLVGFTRLAGRLPPEQVVAMLNDVFTRLDAIAERHGLEKVKTIGDAYMAVAGLPRAQPDHALRVARAARELGGAVRAIAGERSLELDVRIGMHTGPVVAGVIGRSKFAYDLWGDAVNVASRMESHGEPGRVHLSGEAARALEGAFVLEPRGEIDVKGKGPMATFWLGAEVRSAP